MSRRAAALFMSYTYARRTQDTRYNLCARRNRCDTDLRAHAEQKHAIGRSRDNGACATVRGVTLERVSRGAGATYERVCENRMAILIHARGRTGVGGGRRAASGGRRRAGFKG